MSITSPPRRRCEWCQATFSPRRTGGSPQRFCGQSCKDAFHAAAHKWAAEELAAGRLTIDQLKEHFQDSVHAGPDSEVEPYGDMLTSPHGHYDVWNKWQSKGHPDASLRATIAASEYEEWPRGRIVFDTRNSRFTLYADMQILKRPPLLSAIRELFELPKRGTEAKPDSHYRSTRKLLG